MKKRSIFSSLLLLFSASPVPLKAGQPLDPRGQPFAEPTLRLKLSPRQTQEISATGTITFTYENLRLIRRHYPAATPRTDVIATTAEDAQDGISASDVQCLWVAPDEIAVTLNGEHPKDEPPFLPPINGTFPTDAELKQMPARHLRLSPDGTIFFRGQPISMEKAHTVIDDLARLGPDPLLTVTVAPIAGPSPNTDAEQRTPDQIFSTLSAYAATKSIEVQRDW